ncbi:MAG: hypothetical protein ACE5D6_05325, partial [Candidatus Zixiibacteriota bacterium]
PSSIIKNSLAILIISISLIVPGVWVHAQSPLPPQEKTKKKSTEITIKLNQANLNIADDYRDILEQLEKLLFDYQTYFSKYENLGSDICKEGFLTITTNLDEGTYCVDIDRLSYDVTNLRDELRAREKEIKKTSKASKLYRLTKSLRLELEQLDEIIEDDIAEQFEENLESNKLIKAYLLIEKAEENESKQHKIFLSNKELFDELDIHLEIIQAQVDDEENETTMEKDSPETAFVTRGAHVNMKAPAPAFPAPAVYITEKDRAYGINSDKVGMEKEYIDSIFIRSHKLPIFVNNLTGMLKISGWEQDKIVVNYEVEIQSANYQIAKDFINEIEIELYVDKKGAYLNSRIPNISDPSNKIINSYLHVKVPSANKLICDNSYGETIIKNIENKLRLNSNHSDVQLSNIIGGLEAVINKGSIELKNSKGVVDIKSSLSPITISKCNADIEVENAYAPVKVSNSEGALSILNSGKIIIRDHTGLIDIKNNNGMIKIKRLTGSLTAKNSLQPLLISDINGSVSIENINASINVEDIQGILKVSNKFGLISGKHLNGPINLTNQKGEIDIILNEYLKGPSFINADYSLIKLMLSPKSEIFLSARTDGGVIRTGEASQVENHEDISSTQIAYGDGKNPLNITGRDATIIIDEYKR